MNRELKIVVVVLLCTLVCLPSLVSAKRKAMSPIICSGNQDLVIRNRIIRARRVAVRASGNCDLTIVNSVLIGGKIALQVTGNADVKLRGNILKSARYAVVIGGNGTIKDRGLNQYRGKIRRVSRAATFKLSKRSRIMKNRGAPRLGTVRGIARSGRTATTVRGSAIARSFTHIGPPRGLKKARPIYCVGSREIVLKKQAIVAAKTAIVLMGSCRLKIVDSWISGNHYEIHAMGSAEVVIVRSYVGGKKAAIQIYPLPCATQTKASISSCDYRY